MEAHSDIYYDATVISINQPSEFTVSYTPTINLGPLDEYRDGVNIRSELSVDVALIMVILQDGNLMMIFRIMIILLS
jgi:hypothetical protein